MIAPTIRRPGALPRPGEGRRQREAASGLDVRPVSFLCRAMAWRLSSFPSVMLRIVCEGCGRAGRYRLARLAHRFGPEADLAALLGTLVVGCRSRTPTGPEQSAARLRPRRSRDRAGHHRDHAAAARERPGDGALPGERLRPCGDRRRDRLASRHRRAGCRPATDRDRLRPERDLVARGSPRVGRPVRVPPSGWEKTCRAHRRRCGTTHKYRGRNSFGRCLGWGGVVPSV